MTAERNDAARNVLLGTAAVGAAAGALFYFFAKPAPAVSSPKLAGLGAYPHITPLASSSCPVPAASTTQFPNDDDLISYGWCQGSGLITSSTIYQEVVTAINAGEEAAKIAGSIAATALTLTTILGSTSLATTVAIASAVAVPAIGIVVGALVLIGESGVLSSCNIEVPSASGGLETIDCGWYGGPAENGNPGWVPNALNWIAANPDQAVSMPVIAFMTQHQILNGSDGGGNSAYGAAYDADLLIYPNLAQYPTAYQMLKQVQLPAAAAVIGAAPGLLKQLTDITTISAPALFGSVPAQASPLMVQFPALTEADMATLQSNGDMVGAYNAIIATAKAAAQDSANWPIDQGTFQVTYGLSSADAATILQSYAAGHYTPSGLPSTFTTGGGTPPSTLSLAKSSATGAAVAVGALGVGLLAYKLYTGYSFLKTTQSLWSDTKKLASKAKGVVEKPFKKGRRSNPLVLPGRTSATGGRLVAYRIRMDEDVVEFTGDKAVLYRNEAAVATFKPSSFQKTKIRSGRGEVLVFKDQLT